MRRLVSLAAMALLGGCATTQATPGDPYEGFNRAMWGVNRAADKAIVRPAAKVYIGVVPKPARRGVSNFLNNLQEPFSFLNALLQAKPARALNTLGRFVINSTVGLGGLFDVASKNGYKPAPEDLGQTFAVWGARKSPYLMLPLFGPSTVRDGIGQIGATWANPYNLCLSECDFVNWEVRWGMRILGVLDTRAQVIEIGGDTLLDTSADSYAVARSAYLQRREAEIEDRDDDAALGAAASTGPAGDDAALDAALKDIDSGDAGGGATAPAPAAGGTQEAPAAAPAQPAPAASGAGEAAPAATPATPAQ